MGHPAQHHKINYIEFIATDVAKAKEFYGGVFGWKFQDYGPEYVSFDHESAGIDGGFRQAREGESAAAGAPLVVLYSGALQATQDAIVAAGGSIVVPTFEFPGGRRFHFSDGLGNTLAVWTE
jgi:predicted enzyme related to lactoylglutathione lyase